ncbi:MULTISPECIES: hypothetical protein [Citrobacter]|uniref:hypothetical protein n=1 Tax=Citrobacter TaxID=544 RepID=UPI0015EA8D27|nr:MULTISPECIES: hypothetical protein [Citrobacter]EJB8472306.1 hypothetical protein [Citrobacter freundii]EJB8558473.1 hypothetical protein [Citrobacter freundii]MCB6779789.1 hypothetical protein [Citrobacter sp. 210820-DFI.7.8]MCB6789489.1 hypothetical protein [Citrobacter sp. 210820-DFI.7.7]MCB8603868.1 hypothetical protein [Citrobacter europaeus]
MNNKEMLSILLKIRQKTKSIEYDAPYQVWVIDNPAYSLIEDDVLRLKEVDDLRLESLKKDNVTKISLLLTSDINWFATTIDYFKTLRMRVKNNKDAIDSFYIDNLSTDEIETISNSSKAYIQWCEILSKIADHVEYEDSNFWPNYIFVMEGGKYKKITTYNLPLKNVDQDFLTSVDISPCDVSTLTNVDLHSYERKLVLRSSLIELYNDSDEKKNFLSSVLNSPKKLWDSFSINYEIYINKYSINKVIHEVETQKLDFLSKLNSLIQEHQTKSLSIPAVLVSTAIIKGWSASGLLLIFVAMILTCAVVILGIYNAKKSLSDIIESSNKTMILFTKENTNDDDEALSERINQITTEALTKLRNKKVDAEKTLNKLQWLIFIGVFVWSIFVLYQFKDNINPVLESIYNNIKSFVNYILSKG